MLSLGTEDFFAFWTASYSVGLPDRSPPPIRAATSMFLISLANILPRRASMTAFLCLVVAHLEWPDISAFLPLRASASGRRDDEVAEDPVDAHVLPHLWMEGRGHQRTLPDRDDPTHGLSAADAGEDLDARTHCLHPRRADEDRVHRLVQPGEVEVALEGVDLSAEGVAAHGDVQAADGLLADDAVLDPVGQHDHPGAGAEHRHPGVDPFAERLEQLEDPRQLGHRRGLPAGNDQGVAGLQLRRTAYGVGREAE